MSETGENGNDDVKVVRNDDKARYEVQVDGAVAGFTMFVDDGDQRIFPHTEIDGAYSGRGLSSILISAALDDAKAAGKRIVPVCPLVARWVSKHPEISEFVDRPTPATIAFLESLS